MEKNTMLRTLVRKSLGLPTGSKGCCTPVTSCCGPAPAATETSECGCKGQEEEEKEATGQGAS